MKKSEKLAKKRLKLKLKKDPEFKMRYEYCLKDLELTSTYLDTLASHGILHGNPAI